MVKPRLSVKPLKPRTTKALKALGFDNTRYDRSMRAFFVSCSKCHAVMIMGTPCHEPGCPNERNDRRHR